MIHAPSKSDLLAQIAQIPLMERGKLSRYGFKDRSSQNEPYYKLQSWEDGKNATRYIRPEQVPLLEEALAGHAQFQKLVDQYAHLMIAETRQQLAALGSKRKHRRPISSSPKSKRSST